MKKILCILILCSSFVQAQIPEFQINGNATQENNLCYQLTSANAGQVGSIWGLDQINLENSFEIQFEVFLGNSDSPGADGMYFAFQPISTSVGTSGGAMGMGGIMPAIGIEFDTYQNSADNSDPAFDHIAIMSNGIVDHASINNLAGPEPISATSNNVEDGQDHLVHVVWDVNNQTLRVLFDCALRVQYTGDIVNDVFGGDPNVFWGFTAATGGEANIHKVCLLSASFFDVIENQTICTGDTVQLAAPEGAGYNWTPNTGLDDTNSQNPMAFPTETTTYTVDVLDICGSGIEQEVTVFVDACQPCSENTVFVNAIDGPLQLCEYGSIELNATNAVQYTWSSNTDVITTPNIPNPSVSPEENTWYYVTGETAAGCPSIDSVFVEIVQPPTIEPNWDTTLCTTLNQVFTLNTVPNNPQYTYQWSSANNLDNAAIANPVITVVNDAFYILTVTDANGCEAEQDVSIIVDADPISINISDPTICFGDTAIVDITNADFDTYTWSNNTTDPILTTAEGGIYEATLTNAATGCEANISVSVTVEDMEITEISDISICDGNDVTINAGMFESYEWEDGSTEPNFTITETGTYTVLVEDTEGCTQQVIITATEYPKPQPQITGNDFFYVGQSSNLTTTEAYAFYVWSTGESTEIINVTEAGVYEVTVVDENGCEGKDEFEITTEVPKETLVPNAFSPNGDGRNDLFKILSTETITASNMKIYNRWGTLLFESSDLAIGWDGTYKNVVAEIGVYLYQIEITFANGEKEVLKGNVTLIL